VLARLLPLLLSLAPQALAAPLPEGNAYVRALVAVQREQEQALDDYAYDLVEERQELDGRGRPRKRQIRRYQVFHVAGRPLRRLVAENNRALGDARQQREDRRVREKAAAVRAGGVLVEERPGLRLSQILERYGFATRGRETLAGRTTLAFDFAARPGTPSGDNSRRGRVLRRLAGRLWVDEAERRVVRVELHNTQGVKLALGGLGASLAALEMTLEFHKVDDAVWLPLRLETYAAGRKLFFPFRLRTTLEYSNFRRFSVDSAESLLPSR
jgi:hypothetical protein